MVRFAAVTLSLVAVMVGCSDNDEQALPDGPATPVVVSDVAAANDTGTPPVVTSSPATPGSSDPVCAQLSADPSLTGLSEVVRQSTVSGVAPDVSAAAAALEAVTATFPSAGPAAAALRAWAPVPSDVVALDALAAAFSSLDAEVQATCQFPLA